MRKRLFISLLILTGIFLFVFCTPPADEGKVITVYDTTPPTMTSVDATYTESDAGAGDVLIQIKAVDDLTYVRSVTCILGSPTKDELTDNYSYRDTRAVDLSLNGSTWEANVNLGGFSENGIWTIDNIQVTDRGYKTRIYYLDPSPDNPSDAGKYFEKYLSNYNPTAFDASNINKQNSLLTSFLNITVDPNPLPVDVSIVFENDNPEYIQSVTISVLSPKVRNGEYGPILEKNLTWDGSKWLASMNFTNYHQNGSWLIDRITITDNESASITYYTYDFSDTVTKYSYENTESSAIYISNFDKKFMVINSSTPDITNPVLTAISAAPSSFTAPQTVNVSVSYTEAGSGIDSVDVVLHGLIETAEKSETIINIVSNPCQVSFAFAVDDFNGQWTVEFVTLTDKAGNYREYYSLTGSSNYFYKDSLSGSVIDSGIPVITITKN